MKGGYFLTVLLHPNKKFQKDIPTPKGNYPCPRYANIIDGLNKLDQREAGDTIKLKDVGNVIAKAVQVPQKDSEGKTGGTLYTTFIDLTDMQFASIYKLDNSKIQKLDLLNELTSGKRRKIRLE